MSPPRRVRTVEVVHKLSGRVRFRVQRVRNDQRFSAGLESFLSSINGVSSVRISPLAESVIVVFNAGQTDVPMILVALSTVTDEEILTRSPNPAVPSQTVSDDEGGGCSKRALWISSVGAAVSLFAEGALALAAYPIVAWTSLPILVRAWNTIKRERRLNVDCLDAVSVAAAVATRDVMNAGCIVWLICLADYLRDLTKARSRRAMDELLEYQQTLVWVVRDEKKTQIKATDLVVGDVVVVYVGSLIPVDGTVVKGEATVDQQMLTGESLPVNKLESDKVFAATAVKEGTIYIRAEKVGCATRAAQVVELVENAPVYETRAQNYAEKVADRLVSPSLALSTAISLAAFDMNRFAALVTVDFGTGPRVSAPTTILAAMAASARHGVLIKGGVHIEKLARVSTVVFDKTGTLTHGVPEVDEIRVHANYSVRRALTLAAAASARQTHPVSLAVMRRAETMKIDIPKRDRSKFHVGRGVEATVHGKRILLGSARFLTEQGIPLRLSKDEQNDYFDHARSLLYLAADGTHVATLIYQDRMRHEGRAVVAALRERGINDLVMLTGDNPRAAARVSKELGLTRFFAEMLPDDKARVVQELKAEGHIVAVVGDGINDSPALSYADIGISVRGGAEIAREIAGVVLIEEDLHGLVKAVDTSREAMRLLSQNFAITGVLNSLAYAVSAFGWMSPVMSTMISNGSAVLACFNGIRPVLRLHLRDVLETQSAPRLVEAQPHQT